MNNLTYAETMQAVAAALRAKVPVCLWGPPGIGKTSLGATVAQAVGLPWHVLIGSNCDATDIAGLPVHVQGKVIRVLFPEIQACVDAPGILCLDELTATPPSVRAALLRLLLERNAGGTPLHPESRVLCAANPPEHAPNAIPLDAASVNRMIQITLAPSVAEIQAYFLGNATIPDLTGAPGDWREDAADFAAVLSVDPSLLQIEPPAAAIEASEPWGSPRAWEMGLRAFAQHGADDNVGHALLAGIVGTNAAAAYQGIRKMRKHLPTVEEVLADPEGAIMPRGTTQIAAVGLVARVARVDAYAGHIYALRLDLEYAAAVALHLINNGVRPAKSRHAAKGKVAEMQLIGKIATARR